MRRLAVLFVSSAVVFAACSSSGKHADPGTTVASTTAAPTTTIAAGDVAAQPSAGCDAATKVAPGEVKVDTTSGGTPRWYYRHVPPSYSGAKPMPLVIDMHGYSEGAGIQTKMSGLGPYGDKNGFITLTPEGSGTAVPLWNTDLHGADVKFIGDLLDEAERTLCIDQRRIFATGLSNGAFMTSAVACAYSSRIAAVAPVAGIRDIPGCKFSRPVPVLTFHGTADGFVAYSGGLGPKVATLPAPDGSKQTPGQLAGGPKGPSIPQITADWAERNGCGSKPTETRVTSDVTRIVFPCPSGAEVELDRITGGGHAWPGSTASEAIVGIVGKTTMTISADYLMWQFFEAHPLRG